VNARILSLFCSFFHTFSLSHIMAFSMLDWANRQQQQQQQPGAAPAAATPAIVGAGPPGAGAPRPQQAQYEAGLMDPQNLPPNFNMRADSAFRHWTKAELLQLYHNAERGLYRLWDAGAVVSDSVNNQPPTFVRSYCWAVKNKTANSNVKYNNKSYLQIKLNQPAMGTTSLGKSDYSLVFGAAVFHWYNTGQLVQIAEEVSHRCHNNRCVNPAHLIIETVGNNKARNGCAGYGQCMCPFCPNKPHAVLQCAHNPPCMARYKADEDIQKPIELGMSLTGNKRKGG
jgi:hypothetical protein